MAFIRYQMEHEDVKPVVINDFRGQEADFTLDQQGFQLCRRPVQTQSLASDDEIKGLYYEEVEDLLKEVTGAYKVHIYNHHIRDVSFEASLVAPPLEDSLDLPGPVRSVHVDDTAESARRAVRSSFPDEAEKLLKAPFCLINVWRPLQTVRKDPLGVVDARSVKAGERVEALLPAPDGNDYAICQIRASPEHR